MLARELTQGSEAWFNDRAGCATASCFSDILAISKRDNKPLKARDDYLMKLVCERVTGEPEVNVGGFACKWGTDAEPYARKEYEMQTGVIVKEIGFRRHPNNKWIGASSDGILSSDGAIEIKCPFNSAVHLNTIKNGMPEAHIAQVQGQMFVLGLQYVDFISFDPRMPADLKLYIEKIPRDQPYIDSLESQILKFLKEVDEKVNYFKELCNKNLLNNPIFLLR